MKVQKIVSLTPATAKIAQDMNNFSKFVRNSLIAFDVDEAPGYYRQQMRYWKRVAHVIAEQLSNAPNDIDADIFQERQSFEIISEARTIVDQQKTLEDF